MHTACVTNRKPQAFSGVWEYQLREDNCLSPSRFGLNAQLRITTLMFVVNLFCTPGVENLFDITIYTNCHYCNTTGFLTPVGSFATGPTNP